MFIPEQIAQYLQDKGVGTIGVDIFVHTMPAEAKNGLLIISTQNGINIDQEMPKWRRGKFQLIARDSRYNVAVKKANQALEHLAFEGWRTFPEFADMPATDIYRIWPSTEPIVYPRSDMDVMEASVNYEIIYAA